MLETMFPVQELPDLLVIEKDQSVEICPDIGCTGALIVQFEQSSRSQVNCWHLAEHYFALLKERTPQGDCSPPLQVAWSAYSLPQAAASKCCRQLFQSQASPELPTAMTSTIRLVTCLACRASSTCVSKYQGDFVLKFLWSPSCTRLDLKAVSGIEIRHYRAVNAGQ